MCTFNASMAIKWIIKLDKSLECGPLRGIRRNWFYGVCVSISGNGRRRGSAVWESYEYLLSLSFHVPALVRLVYSVWTANGWEVINVKTCMELLIYIPACAATFTFSTIAFGNGDKKKSCFFFCLNNTLSSVSSLSVLSSGVNIFSFGLARIASWHFYCKRNWTDVNIWILPPGAALPLKIKCGPIKLKHEILTADDDGNY